MTMFFVQTTIALVASWGLLAAYVWMAKRAPLAATLYAVGLLARVVLGVGFALSWLVVAPAGDLLVADTRWFPDAQIYFDQAMLASDQGLTLVSDGAASPTFVRGLALWMRAAGSSHGSVHLLNVLVFVGLCVSVVGVLTQDRNPLGHTAAAVIVSAFALSPNLIILASQPLKDTLFCGALALVVIGVLHLIDQHERARWLAPVSLAVVLLGMYLLSGMRAYYGLMMLGLLVGVVALRWAATMVEYRRVNWRGTAASALLVAVMWAGCRIGGGPYYQSLVDPLLAPVTSRMAAPARQARAWIVRDAAAARPTPSVRTYQGGLLSIIERSRRGFELAGGATNMAPPELDRSRRSGLGSRVRGLLLGVAVVFVPVTALKAIGLVSFSGGGRMLLLTDLDTVFLDLAILTCLALVWRHRAAARANWMFVAFVLALGLVSALLVGYVVTNYGTLFRLRLMAAVPLWLLPMALASRSLALAPVARRTQPLGRPLRASEA
jgi:hypothetical protein